VSAETDLGGDKLVGEDEEGRGVGEVENVDLSFGEKTLNILC